MSDLEPNTNLEDVTDSIEVGPTFPIMLNEESVSPTFPEVKNNGDDANIPDVQDDNDNNDDDASDDDASDDDASDDDASDDGASDDGAGEDGAGEDDASEDDASEDDVGISTIVPASLGDDTEDDDTEDEDEDYLQKLDKEVRENFLADYHPESLSHNYEEVKNLAKVTRNKNGQVIDALHRTLPFLTKYERTRVLGQRAKQIDTGAKSFIKTESNILDGYLIAQSELEQKKIPFIIKRPLPNGGFEYWNISDLELIH
jgi:DNA-directed RNA polymerase I, II, and III subunit RPABC2